jgi:hypothetical protein
MAGFSHKTTGVQQTFAKVREFGKRLRRSILMKTGRAGAKPVKAAMIRNARIDSQTWRKSIGTKVKVYDSGKPVLFFVVGPRSQYIALVRLKAKFFRDRQGRLRRIPLERSRQPERFLQKRRPVMYSHLIERKYRVIERTTNQTRAASEAAMAGVLAEAVESA